MKIINYISEYPNLKIGDNDVSEITTSSSLGIKNPTIPQPIIVSKKILRDYIPRATKILHADKNKSNSSDPRIIILAQSLYRKDLKNGK